MQIHPIKPILCIIAALASLRSDAQVSAQNNGIIQVSVSTDTLFFASAFTNANTASLVNNGQLYVQGNLSNAQASMSAGTGALILNGSSLQTILGTQPFKTFDLVSNNANGVLINNNLSISGTHTFLNGIISTSATPNYLIYEAGSSYAGAADNAHVSGWVKKFGNTDFAFPVGNGTYLRSAALESMSASSEFNCLYAAPTPTPTVVNAPLVTTDPVEYWTINRVSGGTARVHLNWNNPKVAFPDYPLPAIRVAYQSAGTWNDVGGTATGNVATTGDITSNAVNSFGNFTFGSTQWSLPLKFVDITVERKTGFNLLSWKTVNEVNTDHFVIERSSDGRHFESIGTLPSNNRPAIQYYSFRDATAHEGASWYRVRNVDQDGTSSYSRIVSVFERVSQPGISIAGNPAREYIVLSSSEAYKGQYQFALRGTNGQLLQQGTVQINGAGITSIQIGSNIASGVYVLELRNAVVRLQRRVVIER